MRYEQLMEEATDAGQEELTSFVDMENMDEQIKKVNENLVKFFKVCG